MKTKIPLIAMLLIASTLSAQQTSNTLPFTAVSAVSPVVTSLVGLSPTGKIYTGSKLQIMGTGFSSGCNVNVDGGAQSGSSVTFISSTEIDYVVQPQLGSATGASHTLSVSCNLMPLAKNIPPCVDAPSCLCSTVNNMDGSFANYSCSLNLADGTAFTYKTWVLNGTYPTGLSFDRSTSQFYALQPTSDPYVFTRTPIGCTSNIETGATACSPPAKMLSKPMSFKAVRRSNALRGGSAGRGSSSGMVLRIQGNSGRGRTKSLERAGSRAVLQSLDSGNETARRRISEGS